MKTAIMIRVSNDELAAIDRAAEESKTSRAGWVKAAALHGTTYTGPLPIVAPEASGTAYTNQYPTHCSGPCWCGGSHEDVPCEIIHKPDPELVAALKAEIPQPRYSKNPDTCVHPFRNSKGFCPSCGDQR